MKKAITSLLLALTLSTTLVYAEPINTSESNSSSEAVTDVSDDRSIVFKGTTEWVEPIKDGLYVDIELSRALMYYKASDLGDLTFELCNVNDEVLDTQTKNGSEVADARLSLKFNYTDYNDEDTFVIKMKENSKLTGFKGTPTTTIVSPLVAKIILTKGNCVPVQGADMGETLKGSQQCHYVLVSDVSEPNNVSISVLDSEKQEAIKNIDLVFTKSNGEVIAVTTDDNGKVVVPLDSDSQMFYVTSKDMNWVEPENCRISVTNEDRDYKIFLDKRSEEEVADYQAVLATDTNLANFSFTVSSDITSLNTEWGKFTLTFKSQDGVERTENFNLGTCEVRLPEGSYSVEVSDNTYCNVDISSVNVVNGGNAVIHVTPKYTLEVYKTLNGSNTSYRFSIANIDEFGGQEFTGSSPKIFAVIPQQCLMITDLDTSKTYTVDTGKEGTTKLDLNGGAVLVDGATPVSKPDRTRPKTFDMVTVIYIIGGIALVVIIALGVLLYVRKKRLLSDDSDSDNTPGVGTGTRLLSLLLGKKY